MVTIGKHYDIIKQGTKNYTCGLIKLKTNIFCSQADCHSPFSGLIHVQRVKLSFYLAYSVQNLRSLPALTIAGTERGQVAFTRTHGSKIGCLQLRIRSRRDVSANCVVL